MARVIIEKQTDLSTDLDIPKLKASVNYCHDQISADFYEEAFNEANIVYKLIIKTKHRENVRGFAFVNTHDENFEELDDWYINLICVTKYQGVSLRSGLSSNHIVSGRDLIDAIILDARGYGKRVKLKAVDNVIGYYFKLGFKLARPNGEIYMRERDYELIKKLTSLQRKKNKTNLDEQEIKKILQNPRLTSSVGDWWNVYSKEGLEAANELITDGFTMVYEQPSVAPTSTKKKTKRKPKRSNSRKKTRKLNRKKRTKRTKRKRKYLKRK